ncbi:MAG: PhoH family protein [Planctomycetota bacterium]|nr:PhoH family protein [Planctomycetota bacterium]
MRRTIELEDPEIARALLGEGDCYLRQVRDALGVDIVVRKELLHLDGSEHSVNRGFRTFQDMLTAVREGRPLNRRDVDGILANSLDEPDHDGDEDADAEGWEPRRRKRSQDAEMFLPREPGTWGPSNEGVLAGRVRALSGGQRRYVEAIRKHDVVFAIGPAGSGKTYLAVAMALEALTRKIVHRLILVRPAVEAGEHLGFLPGDLREKVNPYLRPLYDSLHDLLNPVQVEKFHERGVFEIAPLAFMRGRTLNHAFVILDEAQNTTPKQMKMFLTRLGNKAKAVITGDVTQVDLPDGEVSGLAHAHQVLGDLEGVSFVHLERQDIVRHPLVQRIVDAYEVAEPPRAGGKGSRKNGA